MKVTKSIKKMLIVLVMVFFPHCSGVSTISASLINNTCDGAQHQAKTITSERQIQIGSSKLTIPDAILVSHQNQKVRLYEDVIKDKTVLLSFFYTTCQYICSMQGQSLAALQSRLKGRVGKDVFLISITTDPETDTPHKLRDWAACHGGGAGWMLLTGEKSEINKVLKNFTGDITGRSEMHSSLVYIGNDKNGRWMAINGLTNIERLVDAIEDVTRDRTR